MKTRKKQEIEPNDDFGLEWEGDLITESVAISENGFTITESMVDDWLKRKVFALPVLVFLMLKIDFPQNQVKYSKDDFCDSWGITPSQLDDALAKLAKKGLIQDDGPRQLELSLF